MDDAALVNNILSGLNIIKHIKWMCTKCVMKIKVGNLAAYECIDAWRVECWTAMSNIRVLVPYIYQLSSLCPQMSCRPRHYNDVIVSAMVSQITSVSSVWSTVGSGADQRKHQSSASLALCGKFTGDRTKASTAENVSFDDVIMVVDHRLEQLWLKSWELLLSFSCYLRYGITWFDRLKWC